MGGNNANANANANPFAGMMGMGGMGGMGGGQGMGGMAGMMQNVMANPGFQQMFQNLMQNPQVLQQVWFDFASLFFVFPFFLLILCTFAISKCVYKMSRKISFFIHFITKQNTFK